MLRKPLLIGVLFISMWALLGTNAHAYPAPCAGWGCCLAPLCYPPEGSSLATSSSEAQGQGSEPVIEFLCIWSDWVGCASYEKKPTDVRITLDIVKAAIHYLNPAGKPGGIGGPFYPEIAAVVLEEKAESVSRNGKFESLLCFKGAELLTIIPEEQLPDPPPGNDKWIPDILIVLEAYVTLQGYSDFDGDGYPETETAHVNGYIELNEEMTEYLEETLLNPDGSEQIWVWKKNAQDCPYNHAPQFTSEPEITATVNVQYTYDIEASDPDGDEVVITGTILPYWLSLVDHGDGSATLNGGIPTEDEVGDHPVALWVTDPSGLSGVQSFTITVTESAP